MSYSSTVLADAPKGYWRLGEPSGSTASDSSGLSHDGTYTGSVAGLGATGALTLSGDTNTAVTLDGVDDYINVAHHSDLAITGALTLEAWVKPTDRSNYYMITAKTSGSNPQPYEFRLATTSGVMQLVFSGGGAVNGSAGVTTGSWSHVAVTYTGSAYAFYINGVLDNSGAVAPAQSDSGNPLRIGTRGDLFSYFKGGIDEVAVYNTALSGATVLAHYTAGITGAPPDTTNDPVKASLLHTAGRGQ